MSYVTPKTNWTAVDGVANSDLNRIEGNIVYLKTNTDTALAFNQGYKTTNSGSSQSGYWTKIATVTITATGNEASMRLALGGAGATGTLTLRVAQSAALGSAPTIDLKLVDPQSVGVSNFMAVTSTNTTAQTVVDLYYKAWTTYVYLVTVPVLYTTSGAAATIAFFSAQAMSASLPAGTQTACVALPVNADTVDNLQAAAFVLTSDYTDHPGYAISTNSGNAYSISTSPAPTSYVDGMQVIVTFNTASTGAITLNWNGLGAKNVVDNNGTAITNVVANGVYVFVYQSATGVFKLAGGGGSTNLLLNPLSWLSV